MLAEYLQFLCIEFSRVDSFLTVFPNRSKICFDHLTTIIRSVALIIDKIALETFGF